MISGHAIDLRPIEPHDASLLHALAVDPVVTQAVVGWAMPTGFAERSDDLSKRLDDPMTRRLVIVERQGARDVGLTGLWELNQREGTATTGIRLLRDGWGRGLGTDAVMTLMAWAFHDVGLRRLETTILDFNTASLALYADRCGWTVEGREREAVLRGGRHCDRYRLGILRSDFDAMEAAEDYVRRVVRVDVTRAPERHVDVSRPSDEGTR
jgi:RimJ/RimL family protein N-acetyltransferase